MSNSLPPASPVNSFRPLFSVVCRPTDSRVNTPRAVVHRRHISDSRRRRRLDKSKNCPVRPVDRNSREILLTLELRADKPV